MNTCSPRTKQMTDGRWWEEDAFNSIKDVGVASRVGFKYVSLTHSIGQEQKKTDKENKYRKFKKTRPFLCPCWLWTELAPQSPFIFLFHFYLLRLFSLAKLEEGEHLKARPKQ